MNRHRRHMTPGQLAMAADKAREFYDKEAKERRAEQGRRNHLNFEEVADLPPLDKSKSRDAAGKALGVSGRSVDYARKVRENAIPEVVMAVEEGRMSVHPFD